MDEQTTNKPSLTRFARQRPWVIVIPIALVLVLALGIGVGVGLSGGGDTDSEDDTPGRIGYATEGVVATDPETLQDAVKKMEEQAKVPGVALEYKNMAFSDNGKDFECYIGNSKDNTYDMFITIYGDVALTDQLFLSELLRPGSRFEQITLEKTLEPGNHTAYVVYTQVADEEDENQDLIQTIHAQVATTITLVVNP